MHDIALDIRKALTWVHNLLFFSVRIHKEYFLSHQKRATKVGQLIYYILLIYQILLLFWKDVLLIFGINEAYTTWPKV